MKPSEDESLPPRLREALRIMEKRGPVVELTAPKGDLPTLATDRGKTQSPRRPDVDDPRVVALAEARQQLSHEGMLNPTYDELPPDEQEGCRWAALHYLTAAVRAGLIPSDAPPSDDHEAVYVDDEGLLYTDYRTVPAGDDLVRLVWDESTATSRRVLENDHGATLTRIGWCK